MKSQKMKRLVTLAASTLILSLGFYISPAIQETSAADGNCHTFPGIDEYVNDCDLFGGTIVSALCNPNTGVGAAVCSIEDFTGEPEIIADTCLAGGGLTLA